jgi:hypothetical protein
MALYSIFLIERKGQLTFPTDTTEVYIAAVVVAESAEAACRMHPGGGHASDDGTFDNNETHWADNVSEIEAAHIGVAVSDSEPGVVIASTANLT